MKQISLVFLFSVLGFVAGISVAAAEEDPLSEYRELIGNYDYDEEALEAVKEGLSQVKSERQKQQKTMNQQIEEASKGMERAGTIGPNAKKVDRKYIKKLQDAAGEGDHEEMERLKLEYEEARTEAMAKDDSEAARKEKMASRWKRDDKEKEEKEDSARGDSSPVADRGASVSERQARAAIGQETISPQSRRSWAIYRHDRIVRQNLERYEQRRSRRGYLR